MLHESNEKIKVDINEAKITFENIYQGDDLNLQLLESLKNADILLIPEEFKGHKNCFPEQTYEFYSFLEKEVKKHNLSVEIRISDENYKELELHADVVNLAEILIKEPMFNIVTSMIATYLYNLVKQRKEKLNAHVKINVEKKGKTKNINFEGDIDNFERAMKSIKDNNIFEE